VVRRAAVLALLLASCGTPAAEVPPAPDIPEVPGRWSFEGDAAGAPPVGFTFGHAGKGRPGTWVVREADGGKVLVQEDPDPTNIRFPVALASGVEARDLRLSVRFRTVAGEVDRVAGLVFRARDDRDYYLVRANALEENVCIYRVKGGIRETLGIFDGDVPDGRWTELAVEAAGDAFAVFLGGRKVLEARDSAYGDAGRVGLWTKADSVTMFDDLVLEPR
jgi:hypothetical protein